jgi:hypothetical protein
MVRRRRKGFSMSASQYIPIVKGRDGEYGALSSLSTRTLKVVTPLLEIPPIPWDFPKQKPAKTIDQHLKKLGVKVEKAWSGGYPIFVDLLWLEGENPMASGEHPLVYSFKELRSRGVQAIPVFGLTRSAGYLGATARVVLKDRRGACLRVQREDFEDFTDLPKVIESILDEVHVSAEDVDLILDLKSLAISISPTEVVDLISRLPRLSEWRSLTLAATSFPRNLIGLPPAELTFLPRDEWGLWKKVCENPHLLRRPQFGDYPISHPEPAEVDPRIMRPSASIRYTCDNEWLVLKARNLKDFGYKQYHDVCRELVNRREYKGRRFSWGDEYIEDCAEERVGTGNLTTWRKVGTSHHLVQVVKQIASEVAS